MSMFKFKDLYVTVAPETPGTVNLCNVVFFQPPLGPQGPGPQAPAPHLPGPPAPNPPPASTGCCLQAVARSIQAQAIWLGPQEADKAGDVTLKDFLTQKLAKTEMELAPIQEADHLQTAAEIDALQQKLKGAMDELETRKAQLKKGKKG